MTTRNKAGKSPTKTKKETLGSEPSSADVIHPAGLIPQNDDVIHPLGLIPQKDDEVPERSPSRV